MENQLHHDVHFDQINCFDWSCSQLRDLCACLNSDEKAAARGCHSNGVLVVHLYQSGSLQYGLGSHSLVGAQHLHHVKHAECSLTAAILVTGLDATSDDVRFGLFNVISGSWAHEEGLEAIERLGACADFGARVELATKYVVEHLERPSEHLLSSASYHFANFFMGCGLDSVPILMDSDIDSNYRDIACLSSPDLTSHQVIDVDTD